MNTLGIDIGSTYLKAAVFSLDDAEILSEKIVPMPHRLPNTDPLIFELNAESIVNEIYKLLEDAAEKFPLNGLLLSTQMHGFVYKVANDSSTKYISWQDSRSTEVLKNGQNSIDILNQLIPDKDWELTGVHPKPSLGICNLYALLNGPDAPEANGELFTLGSYIISRLTGNNICHITNAAPLGIVDLYHRHWFSKILDQAGLNNIRLPQLAENDCQICGFVRVSGQKIPVFPDFGDQQVSALGSDTTQQEIIVNIATASQAALITDLFIPGRYEVRPYFENRYINTISNLPGGRNLAVLVNFLKESISIIEKKEISEETIWEAVNDAVKDLDQENNKQLKLNVSTFFYPTDKQMEGGSISNIHPSNLNLGSLFFAAYEDMANTYAVSIRELSKKKSPKGLLFSGGVSWKNPQLISLVARVAGLPYRLSTIPNEALNGLYRLSLSACKLAPRPCNHHTKPLHMN